MILRCLLDPYVSRARTHAHTHKHTHTSHRELALLAPRQQELCLQEGCSLTDCGYEYFPSCSKTMDLCLSALAECSSSFITDLAFDSNSNLVGASEPDVDVKVSSVHGTHDTVEWPMNMGAGVSGAATFNGGATSKGRKGRWYFEARISGVCAMVGLANENFQAYQVCLRRQFVCACVSALAWL